MRQGQAVSTDFTAAMAIFILMIISGFYILNQTMVPSGGFGPAVVVSGTSAYESFRAQTGWTVYENRIAVRSGYTLPDEPIVVDYPYPADAVRDSLLVTRNDAEIRSQHDLDHNRTIVVQDLSPGTNLFDLVFTTSGNLSGRTYTSDLTRSGASVWNARVNATFYGQGIDRLEYNGALSVTDFVMGPSSSPVFDTGPLMVEVNQSNATARLIRVFEDSGQVRVIADTNSGEPWRLDLGAAFDRYRCVRSDGSNTSGPLPSGPGEPENCNGARWIDFYDGHGMSIMMDGMDIRMWGNNDTVHIRPPDGTRTRALLFLHDGDWTNAEVQYEEFYDPIDVRAGPTAAVEGVSRQEAADLESESYSTVQELLGLEGLDYNITVKDVFEKGIPLEDGTTTTAMEFPVPVLSRFGNATENEFRLRVWR